MRRRLQLATALAVPALLLPACGGADTASTERGADGTEGVDGSSPAQMLAAASSRAEAQGSARIEATISMVVEGQEMTMTLAGAQDLRTGTARMTMDMGDAFAASGQPVPDGMDTTMEVLVTASTMYVRGGIFEMFGVDGWVSIDLAAAGEQAGFDVSQMMGSAPQDFGAYLDMLRGASQDVTEVGAEDVRGVATTRYTATVDQAGMTAALDADAAADLQAVLDQAGFPESYPMDVWVDGDGLVRRMAFGLDGLGGEAGFTSMSMSMDFFDFGVEVDATPPAEHTDIRELAGGGGG